MRRTAAAAAARPTKRRRVSRPAIPRIQAPLGRSRGSISSEVKSFDVSLAAAVSVAAAAATGSEPAAAFTGITEINNMAQGATVANRIGNKVVVRSIQGRIALRSGGVATATSTSRMLIVYDRQPNGAFPALADILLNQPAGVGNPLSSINIANKSRFLFIRDMLIDQNPGVNVAPSFSFYCKGRWEVDFGSSTNAIADMKTGAIYFIFFYCDAVVAPPTLQASNFRVRYYD